MSKVIIGVIDDDNVYRFTVNRIMKSITGNNELLTFQDGEDAMEFLQKHHDRSDLLPDFILVDIWMKFMDGWDFLAAFETLNATLQKDIKVYVVSSSADHRDIERAMNNKLVSDYIVKPLNQSRLESLFESVA